MLPDFTINDVPINCINQAAIEYQIPATLIISVLKTENGRVGMATPNSNGTFDLGPMQINSAWLGSLAGYGFTVSDIRDDPCKNVTVGAWILSTNIASETDFGRGVGDYHSHTAHYNAVYASKVLQKYVAIQKIIKPDSEV